VKLPKWGWILAVALIAYIVFDVLLTPPAGIETRNPARVTGIGVASLILLFVGLALAFTALVLLVRGSRRSTLVAIAAAVLFLPAFLAEQTGNFSSLRAPAAIEAIEIVQTVVVIAVIGSAWLLRQKTATTKEN
jgi:hypothetical protein